MGPRGFRGIRDRGLPDPACAARRRQRSAHHRAWRLGLDVDPGARARVAPAWARCGARRRLARCADAAAADRRVDARAAAAAHGSRRRSPRAFATWRSELAGSQALAAFTAFVLLLLHAGATTPLPYRSGVESDRARADRDPRLHRTLARRSCDFCGSLAASRRTARRRRIRVRDRGDAARRAPSRRRAVGRADRLVDDRADVADGRLERARRRRMGARARAAAAGRSGSPAPC